MAIFKQLISVLFLGAMLALATGCEGPEYEENDRLGIVPENSNLLAATSVTPSR
ncbi:hypothetical protein [Scytonema sp. PCC 10023]|uniref:hypothetical protein n=1 Tax=Scytonema sp. PCC 10023 TaxID=1680591 RepID=UPI0039C66A85